RLAEPFSRTGADPQALAALLADRPTGEVLTDDEYRTRTRHGTSGGRTCCGIPIGPPGRSACATRAARTGTGWWYPDRNGERSGPISAPLTWIWSRPVAPSAAGTWTGWPHRKRRYPAGDTPISRRIKAVTLTQDHMRAHQRKTFLSNSGRVPRPSSVPA